MTLYLQPLQKKLCVQRTSLHHVSKLIKCVACSKRAPYHVVHVLAWWHSGDAFEGEVHRGNFFKDFGLHEKKHSRL